MISKNKYLILIVLQFLGVNLYSQSLFPSYLPVYVDTEVPRVDIYIENSYLQSLYQAGNEDSDLEYRATFKFTSSALVDTVYEVGVRLRGNTSRYSAKKSFKVSFNTFVTGQKFKGMEKMNLNGEHNDPSIIRAKLGWDILYSIGVPAPRANHVRLYINNQYYGLYMSVEHIDEEFVESRFGNKDGNLYKCLYPADLRYKGNSPGDYKYESDGRRVYDLKTNIVADDYSDIANLIKIVTQTSASELPAKLEPVFNVNSFLKYLAVEALIGHWDGYSYNKNNFYLYKNTSTGKFEFIPYDVDNTFGIDWFNIDWATRNVNSWASSEDRPLTKKILGVDVYKKRYLFYIRQLLAKEFNPTLLSAKATTTYNMIKQYAYSDTYRTLDYGWNNTAFDNSYNQSLGGHVKYGLIPYVNKRHQNANSQAVVGNIPPVVTNIFHRAISYKVPIKISAQVNDESVPKSVKLIYRTDNFSDREIPMVLDSTGFYAATVGPFSMPTAKVYYKIVAVDVDNQSTTEPLNGENIINFSSSSSVTLCVNEVMTSNTHTFPDEYGDYSDWIELYNYGTSSIWLGDITITDNLSNSDKWNLPNVNIQPGEFMLFWADGDASKGNRHLPFKLNRDGEEIGIFTSKKFIDGYNISRIAKDKTLGYYPNGKGLPVELNTPTPGASNIKTDGTHRLYLPEVTVFPNPVSNQVSVKLSYKPSANYTISITSMSGKLVAEKFVDFSISNTTIPWNLGSLGISSGVYIISVTLHEENEVKLNSQRIIYLGN